MICFVLGVVMIFVVLFVWVEIDIKEVISSGGIMVWFVEELFILFVVLELWF